MNLVQRRAYLEGTLRKLCPTATLQFPVPVWDNTGRLVGVLISMPTMRGAQECIMQASFSFPLGDAEERIHRRMIAACSALLADVTVNIRPVEKVKPRPEPEAVATHPAWKREQ